MLVWVKTRKTKGYMKHLPISYYIFYTHSKYSIIDLFSIYIVKDILYSNRVAEYYLPLKTHFYKMKVYLNLHTLITKNITYSYLQYQKKILKEIAKLLNKYLNIIKIGERNYFHQ